jgi:hypothetical protein
MEGPQIIVVKNSSSSSFIPTPHPLPHSFHTPPPPIRLAHRVPVGLLTPTAAAVQGPVCNTTLYSAYGGRWGPPLVGRAVGPIIFYASSHRLACWPASSSSSSSFRAPAAMSNMYMIYVCVFVCVHGAMPPPPYSVASSPPPPCCRRQNA